LFPVNHFDHRLHLVGRSFKQRQAHFLYSLILFKQEPEQHPLLEQRNVTQHLGPVSTFPSPVLFDKQFYLLFLHLFWFLTEKKTNLDL
jgi:hypothetical protein